MNWEAVRAAAEILTAGFMQCMYIVHLCTRIKPAVPVENCSDAGTIIS